MEKSNSDRTLLAAFLISTFLVGLNAIGVRFTVLEIAPFWGATLRFIPASLLLFLLVFLLKLPLPRGRALLGTVLFGALNFGASYAFLYYGLSLVKPGMGSVILALVPLFTLILATLHRQETFRWRSLLGALIALGGIAVVFREQLQTHVPLPGLLAMVAGAVCIAEANVIAKGFPKSHPITTNAVGMAVGSIILFLMTLLFHEKMVLPVQTTTWLALIYLILFGSCAAFILFLYVLKRWPASNMAYQFVLMPFVALTASAWLAGEILNPILLAGAALVLLGVAVGVLIPSRRHRLVEQPSAVK